MDFQDDEDFLVSKRQETDVDQHTNYIQQSDQFLGSKNFIHGEFDDPDAESKEMINRSRKMTVKSNASNKNFMELLEESKRMLFDIK